MPALADARLARPPADGFPAYPLDFPIADRVPYSLGVDMGVIRSEFAAGNARQRRLYRAMPTALALQFHMRFDALYLWQNWINANGFDWFYCPVSTMYAGGPPNPDNMRYELLRFTGDLAITADGWNYAAVTVTAELSPLAEAMNPGGASGGWIIGGTPASPSGGWIIGGTPITPPPDTITGGTPAFPSSLAG